MVYVVDVAISLVLLWIAREDLLHYRIPNLAVISLGLGFIVTCITCGWTDLLLPHILLALTSLFILFAVFAVSAIGGGDAKLLTVALLWLGPERTFAFALFLLCAVLAYTVGIRFYNLPVRERSRHLQIPLGPCVTAAWIGTMSASLLFSSP